MLHLQQEHNPRGQLVMTKSFMTVIGINLGRVGTVQKYLVPRLLAYFGWEWCCINPADPPLVFALLRDIIITHKIGDLDEEKFEELMTLDPDGMITFWRHIKQGHNKCKKAQRMQVNEFVDVLFTEGGENEEYARVILDVFGLADTGPLLNKHPYYKEMLKQDPPIIKRTYSPLPIETNA